jgi:hypothetical protein
MDYRQEWVPDTIRTEYWPTYASLGNGSSASSWLSSTHYITETPAGRVEYVVRGGRLLREWFVSVKLAIQYALYY